MLVYLQSLLLLRKSYMTKIMFSPKGAKDYRKLEARIKNKVKLWIKRVEELGMSEVRTKWANSYRDHSLKGNKEGRRSISLNYQWRLEYTEHSDDTGPAVIVNFAVEEIHPHEYKK